MSVKMQPTSVIKARLGINPGGRIQKIFTTTCRKAMDKYVPYDTGDLRTIVTVADNSITYEVPYARYQYYGMWDDKTHIVRNYTTPGTGTYWDKRMWSADGQNVVQAVQDYVDRGR